MDVANVLPAEQGTRKRSGNKKMLLLPRNKRLRREEDLIQLAGNLRGMVLQELNLLLEEEHLTLDSAVSLVRKPWQHKIFDTVQSTGVRKSAISSLGWRRLFILLMEMKPCRRRLAIHSCMAKCMKARLSACWYGGTFSL